MFSAFHFIEKGSIVKKAEMIRELNNQDETKTQEEQMAIVNHSLMNMSVKKITTKVL
jgi:hypothetical protein